MSDSEAQDPDLSLATFFEIGDNIVKSIVGWSDTEGITVETLRESLELAGRQAGLYWAISEHNKGVLEDLQNDIDKEEHDPYPKQRWAQVIKSEKEVTDLMGFLTLLQMDATSSLISLLQAKNDTERVVLSKHAFTIIFEAEDNDLFKRASRDMINLPDVLLSAENKRELWKGVRSLVRMMVPKRDAEIVRNQIDAHKESFPDQMDAYRKCDYPTAVVNIWALIKIVDLLQKAMEIIHKNLSILFDEYKEEMAERSRKLKRLLEKMKEYEGRELPKEGVTGEERAGKGRKGQERIIEI